MNRAKLALALVSLGTLLLSACVPSSHGTQGDTVSRAAGDVIRVGVTETPLDMVNALRARSGLPPLRISRQLNAAAAAHAADMARNQYYSHRSRDGGTERDRMEAAGYDACSSRENIAWGQDNERIVTQLWIESAGHRANMLNPKGTHIGYAGARNPEGRYDPVWVMLIGARSC